MPEDAIQAAVQRVASGGRLSADEAGAAFGVIMQGGASPVQIAALLIGLRVRGETSEEVAGAARALRAAMVRVPLDEPSILIDTCGTGGGTMKTFNISTGAALLAAGAGARIAKHGNRSFTSQCGSADVLEALGVAIDVPVERMVSAFREAGIVFMYAPSLHPAMRHVSPIRRELAIPTVMNIVGPLANPAGVGRQVIGVADRDRLPLMAGALISLGTVHTLLVHGHPGIDEISPLGLTHVMEICRGTTMAWTINPGDYGLSAPEAGDLVGALPQDNARIILDVLSGRGTPAAAAAVVLNAAGALYVAGIAATYGEGVATARAALANGSGLAALRRLQRALPST
ncbi:MAG: anthranilate phosphoribosyltransferase [Gemmatimonadaceae bacterium]